VRVSRYHTVGAVARDLSALKGLDERLEALGVEPGSLHVLARRRDERLVGVTLPNARVRRVEGNLSRVQWFEFASAFLGVTAVSVMMGAVHLATGLAVQAIMTLAAVVGLLIYHRRPQIEKSLVSLGLPERPAEVWAGAFPQGFALALVTVTADVFDETREAFLDEEALLAPQAVDRRPVF
jgi:hypothetical protein